MDSVRFGRALGIGARLAGKTLVTAVDAATAENPSKKPAAAATGKAAAPVTKTVAAGRTGGAAVRQTTANINAGRAGLAQGGRRFGEAAWGPFVRLSGVLWLEFTGVFFGIFAVFAGTGAWRQRFALHGTALNQEAHQRLLRLGLMTAVFGYFAVSSFVRAKLRERRR